MKFSNSKDMASSLNKLSNEQIESLLKKRSSKKYRTWLIIAVVLSLPFAPIIPIMILVFYFAGFAILEGYYEHRQFMQKYAKANGFEYNSIVDPRIFKGRLFDLGHSKGAVNVISGKYDDNNIKIFNYFYTVGSGKNSSTHRFTICEVEIEKTRFPHIFLKSESMSRHAKKDIIGQDKDVRIKLDEESENKFDLYATQDYEIEVLQIFTPELLQILKSHGDNFSVEFSENKIYFYDDLIIKKHSQLDVLYAVVKKVLDNSGPLLHRLHDDFDAMHQSYRK